MSDYDILLVDDEEDIRDVLSIALSDFGHTVHAAKNGTEALEVFKKKNPSIVITDIKMPGMDGIELLQKVKRENPDTEVIMITGHGDMSLAVKSLKHKAIDFISKPINTDALEIALKRAAERITAREQLNEYTRRLERLVREKTELQDHLVSLGLMIGSISHGIKGLLTGLDGGIYMAASGVDNKDQKLVRNGIKALKINSRRIKKMVLDILFYAKERELKRVPAEIAGFAESISAIVEPRMKNERIDFICDFENAPQTFPIDAEFLRSALINIIDNAIDACSEKSGDKTHTILFRITQKRDRMVIDINDSGTGMDRETKDKIFDLFFSSKENKGTGLGLFITNNIITRHHGTINVKSAIGRGTRFSLSIPEQQPEQ